MNEAHQCNLVSLMYLQGACDEAAVVQRVDNVPKAQQVAKAVSAQLAQLSLCMTAGTATINYYTLIAV